MPIERKIKNKIHGKDSRDGAGVNLKRVFAHGEVKDLDPFLLLDSFDSTDPQDYIKGFPWHPHRGIETVTYLLNGKIEHGDSLGNSGTIDEGCFQWMSAGSGIIHQEMPKASDRMLGIQLWVNMPSKKKMSEPAYRDIRKEDVVLARNDGICEVRIIAGIYNGYKGPVEDLSVDPIFLDVIVRAGKTFKLNTRHDDTVFAFIIDGNGNFQGKVYPKRTGFLYENGDFIEFAASDRDVRVLVFSGKKLNEPVAWGGPIVMNTQKELQLAFEELDKGTFIKHK
ncbi:pirin family protein [Alkalibacter mobilis]|uniref:pirin family protein n=1 Tax=Alkalibacter mobilis TaxID=2787712 RepID=UPI0018A1126A|nr:pirin family protein [Alkalibacter mobilis]MBF7096410.1 pirin family protein [Alkalibacter mobilis]